MSTIRSLVKKCIDYSIEGEYKVYHLKKTPFRIKHNYVKDYHKHYEKLNVQKDKIVFDNYKGGGYGCNCKYVLEELLRRNTDADFVWVLRDFSAQSQLPKGVRAVQYASKEAMYEYATAGVWVNNFQMTYYLNHGLLKKPEQTYIQMWHGSFGIKKIEGDCTTLNKNAAWIALAKKNAAYTDYWISNSAFETQVYRNAFWGPECILEYGHPRNDLFFGDMTQAEHKVKSAYAISDKKMALYVPTFRDENRSEVSGIDAWKLAQSLHNRFNGEWELAVRWHPRMVNQEVEGFKVTQGQSQKKRVVDVTDYPDIQELLAAADVVITDYSSAIFDFALTKRPGFLLVEDYDVYRDLRGLYYPPTDTPFPVAYTQEELFDNIEKFDENLYRGRVENFLREKGSREDGLAAKRVADLILQKMGKEE